VRKGLAGKEGIGPDWSGVDWSGSSGIPKGGGVMITLCSKCEAEIDIDEDEILCAKCEGPCPSCAALRSENERLREVVKA